MAYEDKGAVSLCGVSLVRERVDLFHVTFTSRTENVTKKSAFTSGCSGVSTHTVLIPENVAPFCLCCPSCSLSTD